MPSRWEKIGDNVRDFVCDFCQLKIRILIILNCLAKYARMWAISKSGSENYHTYYLSTETASDKMQYIRRVGLVPDWIYSEDPKANTVARMLAWDSNGLGRTRLLRNVPRFQVIHDPHGQKKVPSKGVCLLFSRVLAKRCAPSIQIPRTISSFGKVAQPHHHHAKIGHEIWPTPSEILTPSLSLLALMFAFASMFCVQVRFLTKAKVLKISAGLL